MQRNRYTFFPLLVLGLLTTISSWSQLGLSFDIPKPKQYEERTLRSEKSDQKKFNTTRRFIQNTFTHYNYFFNANNKLNDIINRAKELHRDDYASLLSFYNYDLDVTARDSIQLDSVIYKATSGIVLHDLRSDWADNMYLVWGAAHYLQKEFDSAYLTFQFINYAFAPKEKDGYYQYIGSRLDGNNAFSISTKEKNTLPRRIFAEPPSRNDAFIWQVRTFLQQDLYPEAASLIITLKNDPLFPKRLRDDLEEVQAYYFYRKEMWDSSSAHLSNALDNAPTKQERARWEYLTAQMYELSHQYDLAQHYYEKSIGHTVDPVLAVYARLNSIRVDRTGGDDLIEKNISSLLKMARRDRFEDYRDIIYYMAAEMELERHNIPAARQWLEKAVTYNNNNVAQRNKAYLRLAEISYEHPDYPVAHQFYDSLKLDDPLLKDTATIRQRQTVLRKLAQQLDIISRQDSLLRIAGMPDAEREDYVRKLLRDLRKKQGLKDDEKLTTGFATASQTTTDLFTTNSSRGEWYFYNSSVRAKGVSDFKARWGNRPNVDNWRRGSAVSSQLTGNPNRAAGMISPRNNKVGGTNELTYEALYGNLPLTPDKLQLTNDSLQTALFNTGMIYAEEIEDCGSMINSFESLRTRFPNFGKMDAVLFHLYYCYSKNGNSSKASEIKNLMTTQYKDSRYTGILTTGKDPLNKGANSSATKLYEDIYDLFIEGKFDQAIAAKKHADSLYGASYWTPQLLYIEAVYYIKQKNDSLAMISLQKIRTNYPNNALAVRATTLVDVLGRRAQIEDELTKLQVERPLPEQRRPIDTTVRKQPLRQDSTTVVKKNEPPKTNPAKNNLPVKQDTISKKPMTASGFVFNANSGYAVMIVLNKVDIVFGNEARNAFFRYDREHYPNRSFDVVTVDLDPDNKLLLIRSFETAQAAMDYALRAKPLASSEIIPWMKPEKYSFSIISEENLPVLQSNKDISGYKRFLDQNLPGKF
jgi:outer membrane protein assembly factor BamD (BamD/ComL family)/uncharacterized protein HemY